MTLAAIIDTLEARVAARELLDLRETADLARALRDVVDDGVRADELLDGLAAESWPRVTSAPVRRAPVLRLVEDAI
jgi:hypothetical protein